MNRLTGRFRIMVTPIVVNNCLVGNEERLQMEKQCQSYDNLIWEDIPYVDAEGKEIDYVRRT